ncbi:MAG: hypothetical protein AAFZ07_11155 [Actinomycetota bacterium]
MPKTIQIRDLDDAVYAGLVARAGEQNISVPELLRREAHRLARTPSMSSWLDDARHRRHRRTSTTATLEDLDELRGGWPDAGG